MRIIIKTELSVGIYEYTHMFVYARCIVVVQYGMIWFGWLSVDCIVKEIE